MLSILHPILCTSFQATLRESRIFSSLLKVQNLISSRGFIRYQLVDFSAHMADFDISFGFGVSQKMISNANVFGYRVLHQIVCEFYGTLIVRYQRNFVELTSKVSQGLLHLQQLCIIGTSCYVFSFGSGQCYTIFLFELQDTRDHPRNWQVTVVLF